MGKNIFQSKLFTIAGLLVLVLLSLAVVEREPLTGVLNQEIKYIDNQAENLKQQQAELENKKAYLQSTAYLEQQARLKLNYKKPGEKVVYVYHTADDTAQALPLAKPRSNLRQWWDYLMGK